MEDSRIAEGLVMFGLTRQEANIYLCLYQSGELTGYEVAKQTGISRSNVYSALAGLTDKGAAYLMEGASSKYVAVPIEEFCENKIRGLDNEKDYLIKNIPTKKEQEVGYITIEDYKNIWDKVIRMINQADQRIYIAAASKVIEALTDELKSALSKKIKLVVLSEKEPENLQELDECIFYKSGSKGDSIWLIIDSAYALTGEVTGGKNDTCLYTGQKNFISVFKETLKNEIKLTQLQGGE